MARGLDPFSVGLRGGRRIEVLALNSTSMPSPVVFTIRPRCCLIFGSTSSRRCALSLARISHTPGGAPYEVSRQSPRTWRGV
jgi:hypothetical protein